MSNDRKTVVVIVVVVALVTYYACAVVYYALAVHSMGHQRNVLGLSIHLCLCMHAYSAFSKWLAVDLANCICIYFQSFQLLMQLCADLYLLRAMFICC